MADAKIRQRTTIRYIISGQLVTETGLHIGSGYSSARTDATIVRDAWGKPYIPGSSLKGVLRSSVERLVAGLGGDPIRSCQLTSGVDHCLSTNPSHQNRYSHLQERQPGDELAMLGFLQGTQGLCDTCWLFGSPFSQSRLYVKDLAWMPSQTNKPAATPPESEVRHGVGIDRETLTARDQIKFDYEVWPSQQAFAAELMLDRPSALDLLLVGLGLQEMRNGFAPLGGLRSRGLGRCAFQITRLQQVDLSNKHALLAYLGVSAAAAPQASQVAGLKDLQTTAAIDQEVKQWLAQLTHLS